MDDGLPVNTAYPMDTLDSDFEPQSRTSKGLTQPWRGAFIQLLLASITLACYWPATRHGFVTLDDPAYIVDNPRVNAGLTWSGIAWAFADGHAGNWHPLTWVSHMLDCQLFGLEPGAHHFINIVIHLLNTLVLYVLLQQMTGAVWRSALVALFFAIHP